ncbi:PREDICTED: uncharacterized protein LOC105454554 [Wasmannia auropunctata]|uniref:uncharacterized protein LOC105454554 n=1 Tax=Wasmannia auropunctata TaxID=64793 RepID=UPI0005EE1835|nr:PREDICTED: uncharacterized protein LOC105454554 [Wasmannia auropunctata]
MKSEMSDLKPITYPKPGMGRFRRTRTPSIHPCGWCARRDAAYSLEIHYCRYLDPATLDPRTPDQQRRRTARRAHPGVAIFHRMTSGTAVMWRTIIPITHNPEGCNSVMDAEEEESP